MLKQHASKMPRLKDQTTVVKPAHVDSTRGLSTDEVGDEKQTVEPSPLNHNLSISLDSHSIQEVGGIRRFICKSCPTSYTRSSKLRDHLRKLHGIEMPHFKNMIKWRSEEEDLDFDGDADQSIINDRPCELTEELDADYSVKPEYIIENSGLDRRYVCKTCNIVYSRSDKLRGHLLNHHGIQMAYLHPRRTKRTLRTDERDSEEAIDPEYVEDEIAEPLFGEQTVEYPVETYVLDKSSSFNGISDVCMESSSSEATTLATSFAIDESGGQRRYICNACGVSYSRTTKLREHMMKNHGTEMPSLNSRSKLSYISDETNVNMIPENRQSGRLAEANGESTSISHISRTAMRTTSLSKSIVNSDGSIGHRYDCDKCGQTYSRSDKLRGHLFKNHGVMLPFVNKRCPRVSEKVKKFPKINPDRYTTISATQEGQEEGVRRFKCKECGKSFLRLRSLGLHLRIEHDTASLRREGDLLSLSEPVVDEQGRKSRRYKCPKCDKKFLRTNRLRLHLTRKHNTTLPFKDRDPTLHSGLRVHLCHECGKGFHRKYALRNHLRTAHQVTSEF